LHAAVGALDLEPGDEVITSPVSDPGSIIGILFSNAIPIFADVDPRTGNILPASVEEHISERTRAVMPVHLSGQLAPMDEIMTVARRRGLKVIEDCAQAHLAEYKGHLVGTIGDLGAFSFQQSKQMTTGDGGMVITNDDTLAGRARLFADKAWPREESPREHLFLAPNYRMTELQGAVGLAQVRKLQAIVERRRMTAVALVRELENMPGICPPVVPADVKPAWWAFPMWIDPQVLNVTPAQFGAALAAEGIPCQVGLMPRTLLDYKFMSERRTFGHSQCPWSCPHARVGIEYRAEDYPGARASVTEPIVIMWNEGIGDVEVRDIVDALGKLAMAYRR
jgi:dTDP-4-amino-4,6-dideoxygalactose transaminase